MNDTTRILILLFAMCFFWALSEPALANNVQRCYDNGNGLLRCINPDGSITTIVRS